MEQKRKGTWWKTLLIIVFCGAIDIAIHSLQKIDLAPGAPSYFRSRGLFVPAVLVWELLAFSLFAGIFLLIETRLPGKRWQKGFLYGLSFGAMYQIGMFECSLLLHTKVINEFLTGLSDFFPILLMGILLGIFTAHSNTVQRKRTRGLSILIVAFFYLAGRYFNYAFLHINSAYRSEPLCTFMWTLCMGLWVGAIYWMLQPGVKGKSALSRSLYFILVIYGPNWIMNHLFMLTVYEVSADLIVRVISDLVFAALGVFVSGEVLKEKQHLKAEVG
ncbi:MAG TPA: hypothetical protein VHP31_06245 [Caproicibacter sp.]|nr:hypothetical protein [Caproicibacter sp.]